MSQSVGFIGLGIMGQPMALNLVKAGFQVSVFNRTRDKTALLEKAGARVMKMEAERHDRLCAWISHLPQMISTALAATLVDEFGEEAPLLGRRSRIVRTGDHQRASLDPGRVSDEIGVAQRFAAGHVALHRSGKKHLA